MLGERFGQSNQGFYGAFEFRMSGQQEVKSRGPLGVRFEPALGETFREPFSPLLAQSLFLPLPTQFLLTPRALTFLFLLPFDHVVNNHAG